MNIKPHSHGRVLNPCTLEGRNYQVDPYIGCGHCCYYCYVLNQAETDWTEEVWYHENVFSGFAGSGGGGRILKGAPLLVGA